MCEMRALTQEEVLRRFLEQPSSKERFDDFFQLCYRLVRGYLRHLMNRGWSLPFDLSSDHGQLGDLALDVLGPILAGQPHDPCPRIFKFFNSRDKESFAAADDAELQATFSARLFLSIREELRSLRREADPQVEYLKRRFGDILRSCDYVSFKGRAENATYIGLAQKAEDVPQEFASISYEDLVGFVETAYYESETRSQWCRRIFEAIEMHFGTGSVVKKHELLKAVVAVNIRYLRDEALTAMPTSSADSDFQLTFAEEAKQQTLSWLEQSVILKFIGKERLSKSAADSFLRAANLYLQDLIHSPGVDSLPVYFREVMPEVEHDKYLEIYKHPFETTMNRAEEDFKRRLRKSL